MPRRAASSSALRARATRRSSSRTIKRLLASLRSASVRSKFILADCSALRATSACPSACKILALNSPSFEPIPESGILAMFSRKDKILASRSCTWARRVAFSRARASGALPPMEAASPFKRAFSDSRKATLFFN